MKGIGRMIQLWSELDAIKCACNRFLEFTLRGIICLQCDIACGRYRKFNPCRAYPFGLHCRRSIMVKRILWFVEMVIGKSKEDIVIGVLIQLGIVTHSYSAINISIFWFEEGFTITKTFIGAVGGHPRTVELAHHRSAHKSKGEITVAVHTQ